MIDYPKRLVEVDEILNNLSHENYQKIPEDIRQFIKEQKDKTYVWKYDKTKDLKDQDVNNDTIAIISYINLKYLLNSEQRLFANKVYGMKNSSQID